MPSMCVCPRCVYALDVCMPSMCMASMCMASCDLTVIPATTDGTVKEPVEMFMMVAVVADEPWCCEVVGAEAGKRIAPLIAPLTHNLLPQRQLPQLLLLRLDLT